ncbi:MAG TPA: SHOCT domain-containing protein [Gammaproteobacteria bacterium]|nr:SHOCT domain-containing protein [Gammaproteobacteria bacterium]
MNMPKTPTLSLEQKLPPSGSQQITLAGERELRVSLQRGRQHLNYTFDILALAPKGRTRLAVPWRWFALSAVGVLLIFINRLWLFNFTGATAGWIIHGLAGATSLLALYLAMQCLVRQKVFITRVARVPVLRLVVNRPDRRRYRRFVTALRQRIESLAESVSLPVEQRMAGELKMLRRLSQQGVITGDDYERAKKRLLGV